MLTKSLSSLPGDVSLRQDVANGKIKCNFNFNPFIQKKHLLIRNEGLVRRVIDNSLFDGYQFDEIAFWGVAKSEEFISSKLFLQNRRRQDLHYFLLSSNYFGKPGVWNVEKLLGASGPRMTIRLNDKEFNHVIRLTGSYFNYRYTDRFGGEVYGSSAYHITVPLQNITAITFVDEFH